MIASSAGEQYGRQPSMHDLITQHGKLSTKKCSLCGDRLLYEIEYEPGVTFTACHHCDVEMAKRA